LSTAFEFTPENKKEFEGILGRYPVKRAALLPTLHLAQEQHGYISPEVEQYVAGLLDLPLVDVREVLTFYSLFLQEEMGKHHIRVCNSIGCWLRGSLEVAAQLKNELGIESGSVTQDGQVSWEVVADCMGACEIAPMIQLDKDYFGDLTAAKLDQILSEIRGSGASPASKSD